MLGTMRKAIWDLKRLRHRWLGREIISWRNESVDFIGNQYGGAYVALGPLSSRSVVYSIGVGEDISLDEQLIQRTGCTVVGVDPTPRAQEFVDSLENLSGKYSLVDVGLAAESGTQRFFFPRDPSHVSMSLVDDSGAGSIEATFLTLDDLMKRLGHAWVDFLKIDIEGEEYKLLNHWLSAGYSPPASQIWIEFHPQRVGKTLRDGIDLVRKMTKLGFVPVSDGHSGILMLNVLTDHLRITPCMLAGRFCLQSDSAPRPPAKSVDSKAA